MHEKNINFELQGRVRKYLEYLNHNEINSEKIEQIFKKLTHSLRKEVLFESNGVALHNITFFTTNFSGDFLEELAISMKQAKYSPEETIFKVGF